MVIKMSLSEWYMKNHCRIDYTPIKKRDQRVFNERRAMYEQFLNGMPLPDMLDQFSGDYKYLKQNDEYATLVFKEKHYQPDIIRAERGMDDAILFHDRDTKEAIALTYNTSEFEGWKDN